MYQDVIDFWFNSIKPAAWWKKDAAFDASIRQRFGNLHEQAIKCELYEWRATPHGRLAEIIVLDQFSRNIFRNLPQAFAADPLALALSQEAIHVGADSDLSPEERCFLYMPYMHSESRCIHEVAVQLFEQNGIQDNLDYELKHKAVIDHFGRYPHRNAILDRQSTDAEIAFLKQPGSRF